MMTSRHIKAYRRLVGRGLLTREQLVTALGSAAARQVDIETILVKDYGVPRQEILGALSSEFDLPAIAYDERLPVPPELLEGLDPKELDDQLAFPVILNVDTGTAIIAANDPESFRPDRSAGETAHPTANEEFSRPARDDRPIEARVALAADVQAYKEDFLNDYPGRIIGSERTGLAFWRNTMAHWRTRLACYRNDLAKARVALGVFRWGLGFVTLAGAAIVLDWQIVRELLLYWVFLVLGIGLTGVGIFNYLKLRRALMKSPGPHTLVEVTAATVSFLENYNIEYKPGRLKETMLSRLGDFLPNCCGILRPEPASRERTHLARERNILAAQRTMAACYRTIYARARTGLAFIRTGIVFLSIGAGLLQVFRLNPQGVWGLLLAAAGILMIMDGLLWYLPARREEPDLRRQTAEPVIE